MFATRHLMPLITLAAAIATPAAANYFSNPNNNTNLNIGSAPSPTPYDLRLAGDSAYGTVLYNLRGIIGKPAYTRDLHYLGSIQSVDQGALVAQLQLRMGGAVTLQAKDLMDAGDRVIVPRKSQQDVLDLAHAQE